VGRSRGHEGRADEKECGEPHVRLPVQSHAGGVGVQAYTAFSPPDPLPLSPESLIPLQRS
jgi:hypothetical protein